MASNDQDNVPPIPLPPTPVEAAPVVPAAAPVVEPVVEPVATPAPPSYSPPAPPTYSAPPTYAAQPTYAGQPGYAPQPAGPAQGLSIASMVCGLGGLVLTLLGFGFLPALAAVILGHIAQRKQPWAKPFWLTGIITGYVGVALGLVFGALLLFSVLAVLFGSGMYFG